MTYRALKMLFCFLLIVTINQSAFTQKQTFRSGIIVGLNFAELEGEELMDYYGLNVGLLGTARLSDHLQVGMEFLFSQNGEYILPDYNPNIPYGKIRLNHLEIPIHLDWLIGVFEREKFYDWNLNIGLAYTRLLNFYVENELKENVSEQIIYDNTSAMLLQFGTTYHFTKHIGLNLKASLPLRVEGLSWTVAARLVYLI